VLSFVHNDFGDVPRIQIRVNALIGDTVIDLCNRDVFDVCKLVSVPPMCSQAFYWNLWRAPPQYLSFIEANPLPLECPPMDMSGMDAELQPELYDAVGGSGLAPSQQQAAVN
jgi:hypothetical protein